MHRIEVKVERWAVVEISSENLRTLMSDHPHDDKRVYETVADWFRRNAGETTLRRLVVNDAGQAMSGVTWVPEQVHTLTAMDGQEWYRE